MEKRAVIDPRETPSFDPAPVVRDKRARAETAAALEEDVTSRLRDAARRRFEKKTD